MSDYDFRHLHTTRGCFIPSIPLSYKMEAQQLRYCPFQFLSCRGKGYTQALAIVQAIQLSYPHIRIFILTAGQLVRNFNRFPAVCLFIDNNMLHSLFCFQNQISCRMIGCGFLHINAFTYSLLKGAFRLDRTANKLAVYGRTIFSLIWGLPVARAFTSA